MGRRSNTQHDQPVNWKALIATVLFPVGIYLAAEHKERRPDFRAIMGAVFFPYGLYLAVARKMEGSE